VVYYRRTRGRWWVCWMTIARRNDSFVCAVSARVRVRVCVCACPRSRGKGNHGGKGRDVT
jgi:hypothetical protein